LTEPRESTPSIATPVRASRGCMRAAAAPSRPAAIAAASCVGPK
jgi:hypothetical protein